MSVSSATLRRESFGMVSETCPSVDKALNIAGEAIKELTGALRDALNETIERAMEAEERISELEDQLRDANKTIESLESEIAEMKETES